MLEPGRSGGHGNLHLCVCDSADLLIVFSKMYDTPLMLHTISKMHLQRVNVKNRTLEILCGGYQLYNSGNLFLVC